MQLRHTEELNKYKKKTKGLNTNYVYNSTLKTKYKLLKHKYFHYLLTIKDQLENKVITAINKIFI